MLKLPTDRRLLAFARNMRRTHNEPEKQLWAKLRNRQFLNLKFRRQVPIASYIADFLCEQHKLIIELDGDSHATTTIYDNKRDAELTYRGYTVLRFANAQVTKEMESVLATIAAKIETLTPSLSHRERGR